MQTHNREEQRPCTNHPLGRTETDQGPSTGNKAVRPGREVFRQRATPTTVRGLISQIPIQGCDQHEQSLPLVPTGKEWAGAPGQNYKRGEEMDKPPAGVCPQKGTPLTPRTGSWDSNA